MKTRFRALFLKHQAWLVPLAFFVLGALVYLPLVTRFGFYKDDWYLMYDARVQGPGFFTTVFASDRPARAPLQYILYSLFGENLLFYQLSAYAYRVLGALALWQTLRLVWPANQRSNLLLAVLFLVYPGFLSQPNAVDFQAHLFSLMLAMVSFWLSVQAVLTGKTWLKWLLVTLAIFTGWAYLGLMEYFIGMEILRLGLLALLAWRAAGGWKNLPRRLLAVYGVFLLAPAGFLGWRLFLFESTRRATDLGAQLGQFFSNPLSVGLGWLISVSRDSFNVLVSAWVVPFYSLALPLRLRDLGPAVLLGLLAGALLWSAWKMLAETENHARVETLLIGLAALLGGLFPVALANRQVDFSDYSRYTLPAMVGGLLVLVSLLSLLRSEKLRGLIVIFLALNATMTHYGNAVTAVAEAEATRNFWWQVAWRAPGLQAGTSLVADYPAISMQEDYFIWGPANQIYFREKQSGPQVIPPLTALVLNDENLPKIRVGRGQDSQLRRGNFATVDYRQVLVLTQPNPNACLRILDGQQPELSEYDRPEIQLVASASHLERLIPAASPSTPPASIFGPEPAHGWCYYYQQAALARQLGDWKQVAALGEKALAEGFYPNDKIEWLPFLQAYAALGQPEKLRRYVSILGESPFVQQQACRSLTASAADPETAAYVKESFCK